MGAKGHQFTSLYLEYMGNSKSPLIVEFLCLFDLMPNNFALFY